MAPPPEGSVRVRATVAYDGAPFHGFARQNGLPTVAGALEDALALVLGHPVPLACAGRTDAGVHARGQVVSFDADEARLRVDVLGRSLNHMCRPSIAVRDVALVAPDFDARHSCVSRSYRYRVLNAPVHDPLLDRMTWHVDRPLDIDAMRVACDQVIGTHDFTSFCKRNRSRPNEEFVRRIDEAAWRGTGSALTFHITGSAFCHRMVRSLVGAFVAIGAGDFRAADLGAMLAARDRQHIPTIAPSHGLTLWSVAY